MNLLRTLWDWLASLFAEAAAPAIEEQECCEEECEPEPIIEIHAKEEPVEEAIEVAPQEPSLTASELIRDLLLSEGATERQIEKFEIEKRFQKWYQGELTPAAVRESIPLFKTEVPACWVSVKLNKVI